jgi:hypothetical protein
VRAVGGVLSSRAFTEKLQATPEIFGQLRANPGNSAQLRATLGNFRQLWSILSAILCLACVGLVTLSLSLPPLTSHPQLRTSPDNQSASSHFPPATPNISGQPVCLLTLPTRNSELLRTTSLPPLTSHPQLRTSPDNSGQLWATLGNSGQLWATPGNSGQLWATLGYSGQLLHSKSRSLQ